MNIDKTKILEELEAQIKKRDLNVQQNLEEEKSENLKIQENIPIDDNKSVGKKVFTNQSPHWKRIDVKQKKITRGLTQLTKTFIRKWMKKSKHKRKDFFKSLDFLLKTYFPQIYNEKRIEALGGIAKIILMVKFEKEVGASHFLKFREKQQILSYGRDFTRWKNKCSTASERKLI